MIIDVTRKPILVFSDEITDSVVIRSIGNREVNGAVTYSYERRNVKARTITISPGASLVRGEATCFETRIILPGAKVPNSPYDFVHDYTDAYPRHNFNNVDRSQEEAVKILPDPFEVASSFKDPLTGSSGTWRIGIQVEKHKNGKTWLVSVSNITQKVVLFTVAARGLDPNPDYLEALPLNRVTRNTVVGTAWDRILNGED